MIGGLVWGEWWGNDRRSSQVGAGDREMRKRVRSFTKKYIRDFRTHLQTPYRTDVSEFHFLNDLDLRKVRTHLFTGLRCSRVPPLKLVPRRLTGR